MDMPASSGPLDRGREAFRRQAWSEAYTDLVAAEHATPLGAEDLERSALAAHLIGRDPDRDDRLARAHQEFLNRGDVEGSARCAFWLGFVLFTGGEPARGGGWIARAARVLDDAACECVVRGYLLLPAAIRHMMSGEPAAGLTTFTQALEIGQRYHDADLVTLGRHGQGRALIRLGRIAEGMALIDEVMVAVTVGELTPAAVAGVYCSVLDACHEIFDLRRAHEWTDAFASWCAQHPDLVPFRGHCLVRRAEVMQLHGEWSGALEEALRACEFLSNPPGRPAAGHAHYRRAELHRLRGDYEAAESAYRQASQCGRRPQPGLAQLRLAQNDVDAAVGAIRHALAEPQMQEMRALVLYAAVEILIAAGDATAARRAADELTSIAASLPAPYLAAASAESDGAVMLAEGRPNAAIPVLRSA